MAALEVINSAYLAILGVTSARFLVHTGVLALPIPKRNWKRAPITGKILIQYPIRNEPSRIVDRFIQSLETIPEEHRKHFTLQILDDYDESTPLAGYVTPCIDYVYIKRKIRTGNKAGNMNNGLSLAGPEFKYALVFDSDHQVDGTKLIQAAEIIAGNKDVVCVQSRWDFANIENTALSIVQETILGLHIDREQTWKSAHNVYPIFNGAGGIWDLDYVKTKFGGWLTRSVCEDTDLSGEVNMAGKRIVVLPTWTTKVDLVETWDALGKQQRRWIKGNGQQLRYHLPVKSVNPLKKLHWISWNLGFAVAPSKYIIPAFILVKYILGMQFSTFEYLCALPHLLAWIATAQTWDNKINTRRWWMYPTQFVLELRFLHLQIQGFWQGFYGFKKQFVFDVTEKK